MTMNQRVTKATEAQARAFIKDEGVPPGTTIHMNHDECGDTRRRLYITVKDDGSAVMWCHNCQKWGGGRLHARGPRPRPARTVPTKAPLIREEDMRLSTINHSFFYLTNYGISRDTIEKYWIQWEETSNRIHYPVFDASGIMVGGQLRAVAQENGHEYAAQCTDLKYISWRKDELVSMQHFLFPWSHERKTLVITEDYLSACKVRQVRPDVDAMPLLTVSMQPDTALRIVSRGYENVIVWLDNDGPIVRLARDKIVQLLKLMGCSNVSSIDVAPEPKKCNESDIKGFIKHREEMNDARSGTPEDPPVPF
jgi:hypothetical protein